VENILTDQLLLARKIYAPGILFFRHRLQPLNDCYQVVFQGDQPEAVVGPNTRQEQAIKVRKNTIIIRTYFEPRLYSLTGTLSTKDKYKRIYEIPLAVSVSNPDRFAVNYFQKRDPAKQAIELLKDAFERYASRIEYNQIQTTVLPFPQWGSLWKETGIHLQQSGKRMFRADPQYNDPGADYIKLQEQVKMQRATLEAEKTIQLVQDVIQQERTQKQKDLERQEKTKDQIYMICYKLRQVAAEEITTVLKERIHEGFESGRTSSQISDEFFALVSIFEDRTHIDLENSIIAGMIAQGLSHNQTHPDQKNNEPETTPNTIQTW
jgi:hypothetical protein